MSQLGSCRIGTQSPKQILIFSPLRILNKPNISAKPSTNHMKFSKENSKETLTDQKANFSEAPKVTVHLTGTRAATRLKPVTSIQGFK